MITVISTPYGIYEHAYLRIGRYQADSALFIEIDDKYEGGIVRLTVCLGDDSLAPDESYVDVNNFPDVLEFIKNNRLGLPTGKTRKSGFVTYPVVKFDMERLLQFDHMLSPEVKTCI